MKNIGPLIINIDDIKLSANEKIVIKHDLIGGIILFSHNYSSQEQLLNLIDDIKSIKDNIYIAIDHEGGRVQRLLKDFTHLPSLESISDINDKALAKDIAYASGYIGSCELSNVGININFSPIVDINHFKENQLLKDRTFGNDLTTIISLASEYIKGTLKGGILPALKHYPGHGRVISDSHVSHCISDVSYDDLKISDLLPFQELANTFTKPQIPIMTSHVQYNKIDDKIVTYSRKWLKDKASLIFTKKAFFISDDVEMYSAKSKNNEEIPCDERVIMALNAGCRLIIATTMQNNMLINEKLSHKYFSEKYLTKNIIEYYEKNHDKMFDIELPDILNRDITVYNSTLMSLNKWSSKL